jgi:hypothetical protein
VEFSTIKLAHIFAIINCQHFYSEKYRIFGFGDVKSKKKNVSYDPTDWPKKVRR